jgi:hypothetical protein
MALLVVALAFTVVPSIAAGGLLHPLRVALYREAPHGCVAREFDGDGLRLRGWNCVAAGPRRGSIVYLHGVADNRSSAVGVIELPASSLPKRFQICEPSPRIVHRACFRAY